MSAIDSYQYTCIGVIECPTPYRLFAGQTNVQPIHIALYLLEQTIPEHEDDFQGKVGDILIGGGGGEAPAMLIRLPDAFIFYTYFDDSDDEKMFEMKSPDVWEQKPFQAFWTPSQSYMLCAGFETLGWNPEERHVEGWLTHHVLAFLQLHFPKLVYKTDGIIELNEDGSICRLLTPEEEKFWNWKKHRGNRPS